MTKLSKINEVEDFSDPKFIELRKMFQEDGTFLGYPEHNRKIWEMVMAVQGLEAYDKVNSSAEILGIGAAKEETISVLSHLVKRVFATDMYLDGGSWSDWFSAELLIDPKRSMPNINERRVVFQHVDGRNLPYEDDSFDGIFSSSSIEHFGNESDIRRALEEAHRVLKPGGVASVSTEFKLSGPGDGWDNVQVFDLERLQRVWLDGIGWELSNPIESLSLPDIPDIDFIRSIRDREYAKNTNPHLTLNNGVYRWTSVHLTLIKC